ncbi:MAG: glycosyl hydrolase, partial [Bacteroidota bacterium]
MKRHGISLILVLCVSISFLFAQKKEKPSSTEKTAQKELLTASRLNGIKLRHVGPALMSGRIGDFAVNPQKPSEYYVAVSSGGVWKTENNGITFKPLFDKQASYSIGCITLDPQNPHVVWVGTGENNAQRSVGYGDGVYKSMDGGKSWKNMGLKASEHIGKIIIHPENAELVYVAAQGPLWNKGGQRGIYKTEDGGKTWKSLIEVDEHTGVTDIAMDPRDPNTLYAATWQRRRHVWTYISGGPGSALYKSTDGGDSWRKVKGGFPGGDLGRIGLAVSPANPDYVYAIVEAEGKKGGFYRSTNRGETWEKRSNHYTIGLYYDEIFCDPKDVNRVYSMDTYAQVTEDGGKTFNRVGETNKHVDNHALWINPDNTDHILMGCDGGIYESYDRGKIWDYKANLSITQFYRVTTDNTEPFYHIYGGTQDNSSMGGPSRTTHRAGILNSDWYLTKGGDGFESAVDPENPNIVYAQSQYGVLARFDKQSGEQVNIQPQPGKGEPGIRYNWDAPLFISPHSPTRLYFAANILFKSDDRGNSWEAVSPDLTRKIDRNKLPVMDRVWGMDAVAKNKSTSIFGNITALSESPLEEGLIYIGTDDGLVQITTDGGENWRKLESFPGVPEMTYVNQVITSNHDRNTAYAVFNNHKNGDYKPYVLKTSDGGYTWTSLNANLPQRGTTYTIAEDHVDPNLLFVGTEFGLFFSANGGSKWTQLKGGLPTIAVKDLDIQKRENDLVLATFGRGFFVLDDYSPLR